MARETETSLCLAWQLVYMYGDSPLSHHRHVFLSWARSVGQYTLRTIYSSLCRTSLASRSRRSRSLHRHRLAEPMSSAVLTVSRAWLLQVRLQRGQLPTVPGLL